MSRVLTGGRNLIERALQTPLTTWCVLLVVPLMAVVYGWIAATGSLLPMALAIGLLGSAFFIMRLDLAVSAALAGTLLIMGPVGLFFPFLSKMAWLFSMLGFFLLFACMLARLTARHGHVPLPGFMQLLLLLMLLTSALSFVVGGGVAEVVAGIKRSWQLWGVMLAMALMPPDNKSYVIFSGWVRLLVFVAVLQLPFALYQYVALVPLRMGMGHGVVPIDIVAGTFEASMTGGGSSGTMAMFLILVMASMLSLWRDGLLNTGQVVCWVLWLGAPLFVGETKLVLILLPLMLLMVFVNDIRQKPVVALLALVLGALVTAMLAWVYFQMLATDTMTPAERLQQVIDYNLGHVGYSGRSSLNRMTSVTFWFTQHGWQDPVTALFGHGLGSSYSGDGSLVPGHLNKRYAYLDINLTTISTLLWDSGLLGVAMLLSAFVMAWRASSRLWQHCQPGKDRAILLSLRISLLFNGFMLFYSNSMLSSMSHEALLAFTFGYLAWLARRAYVAASIVSDKGGLPQLSA